MNDFLHNLEWVLPLRHPWLTPVFEAFTLLGYTPFFILALPVLYWVWNKEAGTRLALVVLISALLNFFFKDLFQDPRPLEFSIARKLPESYGLPSGHTQLAIAFWGWLALEIRTRWFSVLAAVLIVGISFSRLYLGVHDVEDVIGGSFLGIATVAIFYGLFLREKKKRSDLAIWILGGVLILGLIILWPGGGAWAGKVTMILGFYPGWARGVSMEKRCVRFEKIGNWKALAAVLLGVAILGIAAKGMITLVQQLSVHPVAACLIGGFLIAFLITFLIPLLLVRIGLLAPRGQSKMT